MKNLLAEVRQTADGYTGHATVYAEGGQKWTQSTEVIRPTRRAARQDARLLAREIAASHDEAEPAVHRIMA